MTNCWVIVEPPWTAPPERMSCCSGSGDAEEVDPAVLVEALVLDRDDRLLHRRRDLLGLEQDPPLVPGQGGQLGPVGGAARPSSARGRTGRAPRGRAGPARRPSSRRRPRRRPPAAASPATTKAMRSFFSRGFSALADARRPRRLRRPERRSRSQVAPCARRSSDQLTPCSRRSSRARRRSALRSAFSRRFCSSRSRPAGPRARGRSAPWQRGRRRRSTTARPCLSGLDLRALFPCAAFRCGAVGGEARSFVACAGARRVVAGPPPRAPPRGRQSRSSPAPPASRSCLPAI